MFELMDRLTLLIVPLFLILDFFWQARSYHKTRYWRLRAGTVSLLTFLFGCLVADMWSGIFDNFHYFELSNLDTWSGALIGILLYEVLHYSYHRAAHHFNWLWYAGHQMHHSAESLDGFGAYYLHPLDTLVFTSIASLVYYPLLGLSTEAGIIAALFLSFNVIFQHANITTPHWIGYVIQRPESHMLHHCHGSNRYNYANVAVIDMLFGTFRNPKSVQDIQIGFYNGSSSRLIDMLLGKDVSMPDAILPKPDIIQPR